MKSLLLFLMLFFQVSCFAQFILDSAVFDNNVKLKNGIYTTLVELQFNSPKYEDCELDLENQRSEISFLNLNYITSGQVRKPYEDDIFATVVEGRLFIFYHNYLSAVFLKGAISTFILNEMITRTYYPSTTQSTYGNPMYASPPTTYTDVETNIYFLDFKTGDIKEVDIDNLDPIIERDSVLYESYQKIKSDPKNKKSYPYISLYNTRNPIYVYIFKEESDFSDE